MTKIQTRSNLVSFSSQINHLVQSNPVLCIANMSFVFVQFSSWSIHSVCIAESYFPYQN